jgi:hypothetical protein
MAGLIEQNRVLFFVAVWLTVTTVLALLSGWFRLMAAYPDQSVEPILRLRGQSGTIGGVSMRSVLTLSVCPTGLRVGIMRAFGPFCRDFLVPWESIAVVRKKTLFSPVAELQFGKPVIGRLRIPTQAADRMARAAVGHWPEPGPLSEQKPEDRVRSLLTWWAVMTSFAALFFIFAPRVIGPSDAGPPIAVAILFPAIVFGVVSFVRFVAAKD